MKEIIPKVPLQRAVRIHTFPPPFFSFTLIHRGNKVSQRIKELASCSVTSASADMVLKKTQGKERRRVHKSEAGNTSERIPELWRDGPSLLPQVFRTDQYDRNM